MKNMKKKGFTLVELLVVIAIVAILAAVSVVGYTVFINRANMSADQQAVTQMNTMLEALDVNNEPEDIVALWAYLNETGLTAEDYKPLSNGHIFVWDKELNRVLLVKDNKVVYPENYAETANSINWFNLKADEIKLDAAPAIDANGAVTVANPSDLITSFKNASAINNMSLSGNVNMMGASTFIPKLANNDEITINGNDATISNLVSTQYATVGAANDKKVDAQNQKYASGFVGHVQSGATVTIKDVTFDGLTIGDYETGSAGIVAGTVQGTLVLENVTIKNCTVYGQNKVGIIAGQVSGNAEIIMKNVKIENCTVKSSEGEAGKIFGAILGTATVEMDAECSVTNTTVSIDAFGNHQFVTINGVKYVTKVNGNGAVDTKTIDDKTYTRVCQCSTEDTLAWVYTVDEAPLDDTYCGRGVEELTTIDAINAVHQGN